MQQQGFTVYGKRMDDAELIERKNQVYSTGVSFEVAYRNGFGYLAVSSEKKDRVEPYVWDMSILEENADEADVATCMGIGEPGLSRLNGGFDTAWYLEGREPAATD